MLLHGGKKTYDRQEIPKDLTPSFTLVFSLSLNRKKFNDLTQPFPL